VIDADHDGVEDTCEGALAAAFAPGLHTSTTECDWDAGWGRLGGEYYYAVQRPFNDPVHHIRIAYLPAYYKDCGSDIAFHTDGHSGDSEFILVDVVFNQSARWETTDVFLSAHCAASVIGVPSDPDCQWWSAADFDGFAGWVDGVQHGAPIVWVSEGKHANYRWLSLSNGTYYRFPVWYSWQNIGSSLVPSARGVGPRWSSTLASPSRVEDLWAEECITVSDACHFNGWQPSSFGGGATPYGILLRNYAGFILAGGTVPPNPSCDPQSAFIPCDP
jgi:hypothetical protein